MKLILITINNLVQFSTVKALKKRIPFFLIKKPFVVIVLCVVFTFKCSCGLSAEQV